MKKIVGLCVAALVALGLFACASTGNSPSPGAAAPAKSERELAIERAAPIRTEPARRPDWVDVVPRSQEALFFIGSSLRYATAAQARDNAQENGRRQLVDYYGTIMVNKGREYSATYGISSEVFSPQMAAQALGAREFYTQVYLDDTNREAFEVNALMEIDKAIVAKVIDDFGKEVAADMMKKAAAEQDARRREQLEKTTEFFGGNLSSTLGF